MRFPIAVFLTSVSGLLCLYSTLAAEKPAENAIQFNRDIRPLLSEHCFACHGPDAKKREAELRLDTEEGLLGKVAPGKLDESELYRRITLSESDEQMPPAEFGKSLSDTQIAMIRQWIEAGAPWQGHWSLETIGDSKAPDVVEPDSNDSDFIVNVVDRFTLKSMRAHDLRPSPSADRSTLARRLSFDLTGLPPNQQLVNEFVSNNSPQAYNTLVASLLESPHFGERMAMWWLDLVRYADTVGYHGDQNVSVSPYRDYVIESFNRNKPFDEFTTEQLAGDLFPNPTLEQKIAAGYNRLGMMSAEGGVQPKEYLAKYIAERVRNLGGTWMGATLGCCECHDHKYDPFTMKDFYSFEAFFADIQERGLYSGANTSGNWGSNIKVPSDAEQQKLADLDRQIKQQQDQLTKSSAELVAAQKTWEQSLPVWHTLVPKSVRSRGGATLTIQDDGSILASGDSPDTDIYNMVFDEAPQGITGIRIEVIPHKSLPQNGSGRAGNGNFVLTELVLGIISPVADGPKKLALQNATATYEQTGAAGKHPYKKWAIAAAIDRDEKGKNWGWAIMEKSKERQWAVIETVENITLGDKEKLFLQLQQAHDNPRHTLGHFRISVATVVRPVIASQADPAISAILAIPADQRTPVQFEALAKYYRGIAPLLVPVRKKNEELKKQRQQLEKSIRTTLVTTSVKPRMIRILSRGNWMDTTGEVVEPSFPEFISVNYKSANPRLNRLDLAKWLLAKDHPLTARVFVNRVWKLYFGSGLSRRLDDFGAQGDWPSHPELLDYLAQRFIDSGWDIKALIKLIVLSGTYRQSSLCDAPRQEKDPQNRWLARQSRFRLDAEMIRDNALSVSGLLIGDVGGASVRPYQPAGYLAYLNFPMRTWKKDSGTALYRRGIYVHWQRQYLHPAFLAFDAPSREECTAERARSNTPLQSLVLLNDPVFVEAARVFAERVLRSEQETDDGRLTWAFQQTLSRKPRAAETELLLRLLKQHREHYRSEIEEAKKLISTGDTAVATDLDFGEWAAWTSVTRTLLNLHETITRN